MEIGEVHYTGFEDSGVCWYCGADLPKRKRRWCSHNCLIAYWETWNWRFASLACIKRAERLCENCHRKEEHRYGMKEVYLEVHHIIPVGGEDRNWHKLNEPYNLICLCHECHLEIHAAMRIARMSNGKPDSWDDAVKIGQSIMELKV